VEKQREADEKNELVRRTEEMLAERQNRLMKKEGEADKKNELVRRTEEILARARRGPTMDTTSSALVWRSCIVTVAQNAAHTKATSPGTKRSTFKKSTFDPFWRSFPQKVTFSGFSASGN
jgi:hypothetical protein